jgi:hypothetical protein
MADPGKPSAVKLDPLRAVAVRLMHEIVKTTLGDAANRLNGELNDPKVQKLAEEMILGRLLASAGGRLTLGQMKAGGCDCCKWEAALAGSLVIDPSVK